MIIIMSSLGLTSSDLNEEESKDKMTVEERLEFADPGARTGRRRFGTGTLSFSDGTHTTELADAEPKN
jgi:hypothetical protein